MDETLTGIEGLSRLSGTFTEIAASTEVRLPLVERTLRDDVRHIVGTPDLVYANDEGETCIRDYKTGLNSTPSKEGAQLHLYAHLVGELGMKPVWGEIDRLRGAPEKQLIEPELVQQVVARAMRARDAVLSHSAEGATPETCAQCPYLHICPETRVSEPDPSTSVCGTVTEVVRTGQGDVAALSVDTGDNFVVIGGLDRHGVEVETGQRILATGLRNNASLTGLLADWSSVLVTEEAVQHAIRSEDG